MDNQSPDHSEAAVIREILSHALEHKAVISELPENKGFVAMVYVWKQSDTKNEEAENPLWERVAGPFVLASFEEAEAVAKENLKLLAGERTAENIEGDLLAWLKEYSGDAEAEFLNPEDYEIRKLVDNDQSVKIAVTKIAFVHDLYLVESENRWLLANLQEDGTLLCWNSFVSLHQILDSIRAVESKPGGNIAP